MGTPQSLGTRLEAHPLAGRWPALVRGLGVTRFAEQNSSVWLMGEVPSHRWGVAQHMSHGTCKVHVGTFKGRWGMETHGAQVVRLDAWRLRRNHVRGTLDVDEFGPDAVPVTGTEIPAANLATCGDFNGSGVLGGGLSVGVAMPPLPNLDVALDADALAKLSNRQCAFCGEVFVQGHSYMVAPATDFASSKSSRSVRYLVDMTPDAVQQHRRERLEAAAEKAGGKAALGRLLGYQDGAFVGQMLRGERLIKEDTVLKLESKPGFKAWFGERMAPVGPQALSPLEEDLLAAFRSIPEDEQQELVQHTMAQAERYNKLVERLLEKRGLPVSGFASATRTAETLPPAPAKKPKLIKSGDMEVKRVPSPLSTKAKQRRVG